MDKPNKYSDSELNEIWNKNLVGWGSKTYFAAIIPYISKFIQNNNCSGSLLDLGCGYGHKSIVFNKIGFCVTGMDSDYERISKAKLEYPNINFYCHKIVSTLPFEDNSFDAIFSCSVFQYIEHESILKECRRVLKNDGCIIMVENLKSNPITRIGRAYLKLIKHNYQSYPWNHFTLSEISNVRDEFQNSSLDVFHFLSPLSHLKFFKTHYQSLFRFDQKLLKIKFLKNYAWLVLLTGINK